METNKVVKKAKKTKFGRGRTLQLYGIMALPLLSVIIWSYLPMGGIIMAFKNYKYNKGIFGSPWVGLKNFKVFLASDDCWEIIRNTVGMNLLFIIFGMLAALLLALVFYNLRSRLAVKIFQTAAITPHFVSWVVVSYMAFVFLNPNGGMLNTILNAFGMESIEWYSNPKPWPVILVIANTWKGVGMDMVMIYAALIIAEKLLELRKYEAIVLQSQLNSHFLFNTLNLLSMLDLKLNKRSMEISKIVNNMSAILKYSMDLKNMLVTIEDEVAYCDIYVEIQKIKYKDKINFTKEIDPELSETKIPKFILQPIVENAIFHGMDKKADAEQIKISAVSQNGVACISVSNTGKTIEAEELKALQRHIDNAEVKGGKHIGLSNINARIKLLYGNSYGVHIKSENGNTQVCVYIPLML